MVQGHLYILLRFNDQNTSWISLNTNQRLILKTDQLKINLNIGYKHTYQLFGKKCFQKINLKKT